MVSAEEWVLTYRQVTQPPDPFQQAVAAMKAGRSRQPQFLAVGLVLAFLQSTTTRRWFGVVGSISTAAMDQIILCFPEAAMEFRLLSAERWVQILPLTRPSAASR